MIVIRCLCQELASNARGLSYILIKPNREARKKWRVQTFKVSLKFIPIQMRSDSFQKFSMHSISLGDSGDGCINNERKWRDDSWVICRIFRCSRNTIVRLFCGSDMLSDSLWRPTYFISCNLSCCNAMLEQSLLPIICCYSRKLTSHILSWCNSVKISSDSIELLCLLGKEGCGHESHALERQ